MTNKHNYKAALAEIVSCLSDEEDGAGYLFDALEGNTGRAVVHALLLADKLMQEPSEEMCDFAESRLIRCLYDGDYPYTTINGFTPSDLPDIFKTMRDWIVKEVE